MSDLVEEYKIEVLLRGRYSGCKLICHVKPILNFKGDVVVVIFGFSFSHLNYNNTMANTHSSIHSSYITLASYSSYKLLTNPQQHTHLLQFDLNFGSKQEFHLFHQILLKRSTNNYNIIHIQDCVQYSPICGGHKVASIYIQNITYSLAMFSNLSSGDGLKILYHSLNGFTDLGNKFGWKYQIDPRMIVISRNLVVKVWFNSNYSKMFPQKPLHDNHNQLDLVSNVYGLIANACSQQFEKECGEVVYFFQRKHRIKQSLQFLYKVISQHKVKGKRITDEMNQYNFVQDYKGKQVWQLHKLKQEANLKYTGRNEKGNKRNLINLDENQGNVFGEKMRWLTSPTERKQKGREQNGQRNLGSEQNRLNKNEIKYWESNNYPKINTPTDIIFNTKYNQNTRPNSQLIPTTHFPSQNNHQIKSQIPTPKYLTPSNQHHQQKKAPFSTIINPIPITRLYPTLHS